MMGILPLQFAPGESAASLGLTGREEFAIEGVENAEASRGHRDGRRQDVPGAPAARHAARARVRPPRRDPAVRAQTVARRLTETSVLGVDLASREWKSNGTAVLSFEDEGWRAARVHPLIWPDGPISPRVLADAVDSFALRQGIAAISLDGPQAWRDPVASLDSQGHGRACEKGARTPAKTGTRGSVKPSNQIGWVSFAIDVFQSLLARPHVRLANDPDGLAEPLGSGAYHVLECFPTSTWRASGLRPLPAKRRQPSLGEYAEALGAAHRLSMPSSVTSHDDLQAIVAALPAAALLGSPARPIAHGRPAWHLEDHWVEGLIWDAQPPPAGFTPVAVDQTSM